MYVLLGWKGIDRTGELCKKGLSCFKEEPLISEQEGEESYVKAVVWKNKVDF